MDVSQSLKDAENSLRDFIATVLSTKHGESWPEKSGVSAERLDVWNKRREIESKRQEAGAVEERILYYADFYDLGTILHKNWQEFAPALGDWKTMDVWLTELERLRDPDAHRRKLLPHQKHLILGISGEIRSLIVRYRSKQDTEDDYFPRIESARDSLGNIWTPTGRVTDVLRILATGMTLRPGDVIDYVITATDPKDEPLIYGMSKPLGDQSVQSEVGTFSLRVDDNDISKGFQVKFTIKTHREFHASIHDDDSITFVYIVLPPRR